jgi:RNase P/RNase MRP subunit p29
MMGGRQDGFIEGMMREFSGRDFRNANGLAGTIISITNNNLVVKDRDNKENTVVVTDKTAIKLGRNNAQLSDLKQNDQVVVIGQPGNNGVINADLIRVFPGNVNPASSELNNNTQNN